MRLPIIVSVGFLLSLGLNVPVLSQSPIEIARPPARNNLNFRKLQFNRRLWNQQNISNYRYTLSNSCFCIPEARGPVVIEVRNGQTTSITSVATGLAVEPQLFQEYNTIPKLFNVIQDAINRQAFSLNVSYSPRLGYPTQINIDYNSQMADEEVYLTIENFEEVQ
ncbi:DUF6174 domain-containing protein [Nodularia sp. NIES-3585]|uniref:DUF6174 domain-containing protein n=1 Tax=Nodularia sp. NIES-3585 TaxID=1973477 RepID=UPI000B5CDF8B|nr:DUF6174 domain-containing protein [Nodularia sp. NIES-3585]GAX37369.1 hypothetical protein NIES3585_34120 [Nodularia sp. NIES-3585]